MKIINVFFILVFFVFALQSQDFKEVKTAQHVVDNYLTAYGGADELRTIESISMKGKIGEGEESGTIEIYFSKKYVYMDINTKQFAMKQAVDISNKKGWMKFGTMIKDLKEEDINKSKKNVEGALWSNFLDPKESGITFELLQNETIDGNDTYVVELMRDSASINTAYFDAKTFNKVKEIKGSITNNFSDFRKVGKTDILMPYKINSQTGDVTMTEIKFNSKFNKKLLTKPKEEKDDSKQDDK